MCTFVTRAPATEGLVPVQVVKLSQQIVLNWHQRIQPVICNSLTRLDRNLELDAPVQVPAFDRAGEEPSNGGLCCLDEERLR